VRDYGLSRNHLFPNADKRLIVLEPALMSAPRLARAQYSENIPRQRVTSRHNQQMFSEIANFVRHTRIPSTPARPEHPLMLASMPKASGSLVDNANHVKVSSPHPFH